MIHLQNMVFGIGINTIDGNGTTPTGVAFDRNARGGVAYAVAVVQLGNIAANMTALKVEQSDDNSSWDATPVATLTNPTAAAGDNTIRAFFIDCRNLKRYLRVVATCGAGATLINALWIGEKVGQSPTSNSERGLSDTVFA